MKRLLFTILLFTAALPAAAQLYHPGEQLFYRVSYKAKMFPNTEVGSRRGQDRARMQPTTASPTTRSRASAARCPPTAGSSTSRMSTPCGSSPATLRPVRFESDLQRGRLHRSRATTPTIWPDNDQVHTRWRRPPTAPSSEKPMPLTPESMDPIALFFNHALGPMPRISDAGEPATLQMVLQDTIRHLQLPLPGPRKRRRSATWGASSTLKFECQLGTTEGLLLHRRHDLHALDLGRRQQNPALHRVARPR